MFVSQEKDNLKKSHYHIFLPNLFAYKTGLVVLGLTAFYSISVYIGPSPREREKEERTDR